MSRYEPYDKDEALLHELGLEEQGEPGEDGFVPLGTVEVGEATVAVEVCSLPAQFWRFTIDRPVDEVEPAGRERVVISTGSGSLVEYWPGARLVAMNCFEIEYTGGAT